MDRLKENAFWIGVVGVVLALGGLSWFLAIQPIYGGGTQTFGSRERELGQLLNKAKGYVREEYAPTEPYYERLRQNLITQRNDYNEAATFYGNRRDKFREYFDDTKRRPNVGSFETRYRESLEDLIENYRTKFDIKESEEERGELPPTVEDVSLIATSAQIDDAMKKFWITQAVIDTLMAMEVGGLKQLGFGERPDTEGEPYDVINTEVTVDMPFSKLEEFVTRLFDNERVLFTLTSINASKKSEQLEPFMRSVSTNEDLAEPGISVEMNFHVTDLKDETLERLEALEELLAGGGDEEEEEEEEEEEDE